MNRDVATLMVALALYTNPQNAYLNLALRLAVFEFRSFALKLWHHCKRCITSLMLNRDVAALSVALALYTNPQNAYLNVVLRLAVFEFRSNVATPR